MTTTQDTTRMLRTRKPVVTEPNDSYVDWDEMGNTIAPTSFSESNATAEWERSSSESPLQSQPALASRLPSTLWTQDEWDAWNAECDRRDKRVIAIVGQLAFWGFLLAFNLGWLLPAIRAAW